MPNWVKNRMFINGNDEQVEKVLNTILNDEGDVDFNKIVPMPSALDVENSSDASLGYEIIMGKARDDAKLYFAKKTKEEQDKCIELGNIYKENLEKYGHTDWYGWRLDKWGTKWNACDTFNDDTYVEFNTAWSAPLEIYEALAKMFPDVEISFDWADEDSGYNVGSGNLDDGKLYYTELEGGSKEAFELYMEIWQNEDLFVWDEEEQKYVYDEGDYDDDDEYEEEC